MSDTHVLKIWPEYYCAIENGTKNFEIRERRDRDFQVGDMLLLEEWDPTNEYYTGRHMRRRITYIFDGPGFGVAEGFCVMSITDEIDRFSDGKAQMKEEIIELLQGHVGGYTSMAEDGWASTYIKEIKDMK